MNSVLYQRRRRYAIEHKLPWCRGALWQLPDDAELTISQRCVQVAAPPAPPVGPRLAHCGTWQLITALPHTCTQCAQRFFEELAPTRSTQ